MITVTIVGIGRVGGALALSLPKDRYTLDQLVFNTTSPPGQWDAKCVPLNEISAIGSDVIFITTQDSAIGEVAAAIAPMVDDRSSVFHTSGALSSSVLSEHLPSNKKLGSIHPLVSISKAELGPERLSDSFFCVEGTDEAVEMGRKIVSDLGGRPFSIPTEFKTLYHASAVTACGHLVALFDASVEMMSHCGLEPAEVQKILLPLVTSTVANLKTQTPEEALTGTFARADVDTLMRHLTTLNEHVSDDLLELYLLLGERSLELAARQGVSRDRVDKMRTKVLIAKSKLKW